MIRSSLGWITKQLIVFKHPDNFTKYFEDYILLYGQIIILPSYKPEIKFGFFLK